MEKKIYSGWAFTDNAEEKYQINKEILGELKQKYKVALYQPYWDKLENLLEKNDIVYSRKNGYGETTFTIHKKPEGITIDELALICNNGYLCFGYYTHFDEIVVYED